jgi:hypothetical protein
MTDGERADTVEVKTRAECEAQGIPFLVDDPVALDRIARIITTPSHTEQGAA